LKLRDFKRSLIDSIHAKNEKIKEINCELNIADDSIWEPAMGVRIMDINLQKSCYPEQRYIVTKDDIVLLQEADARNATRKGDDPMGFGNGINAPSKTSADTQVINAPSAAGISTSSAVAISEVALLHESESQLERKEIEYKKRELIYQKTKLLKVSFECRNRSQYKTM
jgi:hypothetical protein